MATTDTAFDWAAALRRTAEQHSPGQRAAVELLCSGAGLVARVEHAGALIRSRSGDVTVSWSMVADMADGEQTRERALLVAALWLAEESRDVHDDDRGMVARAVGAALG